MKHQGEKFLILLILLIGFFSYRFASPTTNGTYANIAKAEEQTVVINEIAWMGTELSSSDEWIELRNLTNTEIVLDGWKLLAQDGSPEINLIGTTTPNGYFLLERSNDDSVPGVLADLIYTGALGNDGEVLELRDGENNLVDIVEASEGWLAGDNETKQTMERSDDGSWHTSENTGGTPGIVNSITPPFIPPQGGTCGDGVLFNDEECDDGNLVDGDGCDADCKLEEQGDEVEEGSDEGDGIATLPSVTRNDDYFLGDLVINEFVSDPADGEVEWVELYNKTGKEIDLMDWNIEEGSGSKTYLEGKINKFFVIEKPKGNLNNGGDIIILRDNLGNLIDQVSYGAWDDGDINNNAPVADDPNGVARIMDGYNTFNNLNDFCITKTLTKGSSNIIVNTQENEEELSPEEMSSYDYSNDIIVSEILPNPYGVDSESEFVELYNLGDRDVDLNGWKLGDEIVKKFEVRSEKLGNSIIKSEGYFLINRKDSKIALNNGGDTVKLYQPLRDDPLIEIKYSDAIEGWSYANTRIQANTSTNLANGNLVWTEVITPGEKNIIKTINHPPVVDFYSPEEFQINTPIIFDSSDTIDPDGDELSFSWNFGDGFVSKFTSPEHTFTQAGNYVVKVSISDGENKVEKEKIIKIIKPLLVSPSQGDNLKIISSPYEGEGRGEVIINEILPNPKGADADGEFIELRNKAGEKINLLNWQLDDMEGGSKSYTINSDAWIDAEDYLLIHRVESGIALNNTFDSVRLFDDVGNLIDSLDYADVVEGESYARGKNGKWFWTDVITPETENIISTSDARVKVEGVSASFSSDEIKNTYIEISLEQIKELESGDLVKIKGVVAVLPGVLGTQYFYIVGSPGIQVYSYKKDFPDLVVGDYVEVSGEISVINGEKRLKTKTKDDIVKIARQDEPSPTSYTCEKVCEDNMGELITVSGEIVERKSSIIYLDDGTDEVEVYIKSYTGINAKDYNAGDQVEITGIVSMTKSGPRIMPRSVNDIIRKDSESQKVGRVLGEVAVSDEWEIAKRDKKIELFKYLFIIAIGVIVVLGGLLVREMRK